MWKQMWSIFVVPQYMPGMNEEKALKKVSSAGIFTNNFNTALLE
jgi:hypothetical protein